MANITSFSPTSAYIGDTVNIVGTGFTGVVENLIFGAAFADTWEVIDDEHINGVVPDDATTGSISLRVNGVTIFATGFTCLGVRPDPGSAPVITGINPNTAAPGAKVVITGTGFTNATAVQFGGVDALVYFIISDTRIEAYPNIAGTGTVTVTTALGSSTITGFTQTLIRVKLPDLPLLSSDIPATIPRPIQSGDLLYIWDGVKNILTRADYSQLPETSSGGGSGGGGNVNVALGSPFKVRNGDDTYTYDADTNTVTISDIRLVGKSDYAVFASDNSNEFENYDAVNNPDGQLEYDDVNGICTIHNYQLADNRHITIYADGIVNDQLTAYLVSLQNKITTYDKVIAPVIYQIAGSTTYAGVAWPWRRPASEIPAGWSECTDLRGKTVIGQDPSDVWDAINNVNGLSQSVWTIVGNKRITLAPNNIPPLQSDPDFASSSGTSVVAYAGTKAGSKAPIGINSTSITKALEITNPARIVNWIIYTG